MTTIDPALSLELCRYVKAHTRQWRNARDKRMREYIDWYWNRGILGVARQFGDLACVASWRMFSKLEDYREDFAYDPDGAFCQVRVYGSMAPVYLTIAMADIASRHNENRIFMWHRDVAELGPPRMATVDQAKKIAIRLMRKNLIKNE